MYNIKIEKKLTNDKKPVLLKVEAYRKNANTDFAVVVMNAEAFPTEAVKEGLADCLKQCVSY
jgi:hypothetical protein